VVRAENAASPLPRQRFVPPRVACSLQGKNKVSKASSTYARVALKRQHTSRS
jgi:hypothetical protein